MLLTEEETQMLNGDKGPAVKKAMEILVALGESFGAARLVPVNNVHMAGSSVLVAEEAGTRFVEDIRKQGGTFITRVTTNPTAVDPTQWKDIGIPESDAVLQTRLTDAYAGMGANTCNTCIPYLTGNSPRFGEHMAWGESSAVVYANSVCGARTNREGGPSGLASALTGRTPEYGFHLKENRYGKFLIKVEVPLTDMTDYGTLGYFAGKIAGQDTPVFTGIPTTPTLEELKALSAALAASGAVSMFHAVGVTPEAPTLKEAFGGGQPEKVLVFGQPEKEQAEAALNKEPTDHVDWILVGCPNASVQEIREVAEALEGKKVHKDITLWVTTAGAMYAMAERMGYIKTIEDAGGVVVRETCPFLARSRVIAPTKGYKTLTTNSAKMAFYAPGQFGLPTHYGNLQRVMNAAVAGVWR
ncbi:aconitase X [Cupriavidus consociatus]|uniref:aconitase X n=1 Tax=Cupriavidus consociatus TaxID=2821357 RepID=UPI001AE55B5D|nr:MULTISPECIES: aconitase X catalytic domain-containing protein [unclassified Cupriavidus]MBP0622397.1 aconitase X catalytic domain-containing protein [Cupriavidus sp. LEh25]MDK2659084.1 aconitase X catalytic domain-containing protein [Cupriavidus sp. LEh21]